MTDYCEDTIKAVQAHMQCGWDQAVGMLEGCNTEAEVDAITGIGPRVRDEYQEHIDRQMTGDDQ